MNVDEDKLLDEARGILESNIADLDMPNDHLICECMCISAGDIREIFREKEFSLEYLCQELKLGSGCKSCIKNQDEWLRKL